MPGQDSGTAVKANEFLFELKARTAPMHIRLESSGISKNLMSENVTLDHYLEYLGAMYKLTHFTEGEVFPQAAAAFPDLEQRKKLSWVAEDLTAFDRSLPDNDNGYAHVNFSSTAEMLGWVYVVEGSTLGGRLILKFLNGKFDGLQEKGSRFLDGYGAETGTRWKEFLAQLSDYSIRNEKEEEVIGGAVKAFEAIYSNFNV